MWMGRNGKAESHSRTPLTWREPHIVPLFCDTQTFQQQILRNFLHCGFVEYLDLISILCSCFAWNNKLTTSASLTRSFIHIQNPFFAAVVETVDNFMRRVIKPRRQFYYRVCGKISFFALARWLARSRTEGAASSAGQRTSDDRRQRVQPDVRWRQTYEKSSRQPRVALYSPAAAIDLQTRAPSPIPRWIGRCESPVRAAVESAADPQRRRPPATARRAAGARLGSSKVYRDWRYRGGV